MDMTTKDIKASLLRENDLSSAGSLDLDVDNAVSLSSLWPPPELRQGRSFEAAFWDCAVEEAARETTRCKKKKKKYTLLIAPNSPQIR